MKNRIVIIALLLAGVAPLPLAAQPMAGMEAQKKTEQASHQGTGKVVSVDRAKLRIKLAHEPIKSLGWSAMMMDFSVVKASLLDGLKAGDAVRFELRQLKPDDLVWVIVKIERR
ncbi:MAG: copper-binding protein [Gallionella sp.]|nr:copper-binding protein [Gallionella sp.]